MGAEALPVAPVPEQLLVTPVRRDVIDNGCGRTTDHAFRMEGQILGSGLLPVGRVAALAGARAARIMATVPGAGAFDLALAALAVGHSAATGADMGRAGHQSFPFRARSPARSKSGSRPAAMFAAR